MDFGLRNPGAYELAFIIRRPGRSRSWKPHIAYDSLRSVVGRCLTEKGRQKTDGDVAGQAIWAAVHGIRPLLILRPSIPWADKEVLIRRVIDSAVGGLVAS